MLGGFQAPKTGLWLRSQPQASVVIQASLKSRKVSCA